LIGPFSYINWIVCFVLELGVVACIVYRRDFFRYLSLSIYMLVRAAVDCLQYVCVNRYGLNSDQYYYLYYYGENLLTILMFFVILQFYQQVFAEMKVSRQIRAIASILLVCTAVFSYLVVREHRGQLTVQFVVELGQNLYFVGVVLTYLLWGAMLKMKESRTRLVHLVLALGIYFGATAGVYALRNLFPALEAPVLRWVFPLIGTWLPLAWGYTFLKLPEENHLVMARLAKA
jgi:hypothetical protein